MEEFIIVVLPLLVGFALELTLGELPATWLPNIKLGYWLQNAVLICNRGEGRRWKGFLFVFVLLLGVYGLFLVIFKLLLIYFLPGYLLLSVFLIYCTLKSRSVLKDKVLHLKINSAQVAGEPDGSVQMVSYWLKNLSKCMVSPVFFYCLGGIPLLLCTQLAHQLDQMIGKRDPEFEQFGKFAAITDDVLNFIPSRIAALMIVLISRSNAAWKSMMSKGHLHASPNSGYPLMAVSGVIGMDLSVEDASITQAQLMQVRSLYYAVSVVLVMAIAIYYFNW